MKGILRIGGALAFGILIILGALSVRTDKDTEALTGQIIVSQEPNREYIQTTDADGDGVKDWKNGLEGFETIDTPIEESADSEPYVPPTTLTGKFSEAFLKDFLEGKMNGQDFSDPSELVGNAVTAIDANSTSVRHLRTEFTIVPDSFEAIYAYGNSVSLIMKTHSISNENEMVILQRALAANDPALLEPLMPIHNVYVRTITDTLMVPVPQSLVDEHIQLLNAYEEIRTDIEAMQVTFTDPLYSLARVRGYEEDAKTLSEAFRSIFKALSSNSISYTNDEPGSFFYLFES